MAGDGREGCPVQGGGFLEKLAKPFCLGIIQYRLGKKEGRTWRVGGMRDLGLQGGGTQWRKLGSEGEASLESPQQRGREGIKALGYKSVPVSFENALPHCAAR